MSNQHRYPGSLPRLAATVSAVMALIAFLCPSQGITQITINTVSIAPDLTQSVPGSCSNYDSVLHNTGVAGSGNPDRCRSTAITPLFDGMPLGTNMLAFLNSPSHLPLFTVTISRNRGGQYCASNSRLMVALSASLQATRLKWTGAPTGLSACTQEVTRVNAVSTPPSSAVVQARMSALLHGSARELQSLSGLTACALNPRAAGLALDQKVWSLLQRVANDEVTHFESSVAPFMDATTSCPAKCNLCYPGWVGSIQCTATAPTPPSTDTSYRWHEVQTWDVGGTPTSGTAGHTIYPANVTATGSGSKLNGPSWTINATAVGTLTDAGVNANKRFSTSNGTIPGGGITWSDGTQSSDVGEMQVEFNADQLGGNTATNDPNPNLPACINAKQLTVACSVSCTWNLLHQ